MTLQFGGSDQWGNLTGGVELIRRSDGGKAHAFATPLVTKADGTKYGKTEGGALWLDPRDDVAVRLPPVLAQRRGRARSASCSGSSRSSPRAEIEALEAQTAEKPFLRAAQKALADAVTTEVHGAEETEHAKAAAAALFGGGDLRELSASTLAAALREAGSPRSAATGTGIVDLLVETGLVKSKGEARRTIGEGGAYLNNERVTDPDHVPGDDDLIGGTWLVLRRGKKNLAGVEVR